MHGSNSPLPAPSKRRPKLAEIVASRIIQDLAAGVHRTDSTPVSEEMFLQRYGSSRGTTREALRILEVQGVIELKPGLNGGVTFLAPSSGGLTTSLSILLSQVEKPLHHVVEARISIEPLITRLAALRATDSQLADVYATVEAMETETDNQSLMLHYNREFHNRVAIGSHNAVLRALQESLALVNDGHFAGVSYTMPRLQGIAAAHRRIYEALARRDADGAANEAQQHIEEFAVHLRHRYPELLAQPAQWLVPGLV